MGNNPQPTWVEFFYYVYSTNLFEEFQAFFRKVFPKVGFVFVGTSLFFGASRMKYELNRIDHIVTLTLLAVSAMGDFWKFWDWMRESAVPGQNHWEFLDLILIKSSYEGVR